MNQRKSAEEPGEEWPLRPENPARQALREVGITHLNQLTRFSEAELLKLHGVGPKAIRLLREALTERGLTFTQPEPKSAPSKTANRRIPRRAPNRKG